MCSLAGSFAAWPKDVGCRANLLDSPPLVLAFTPQNGANARRRWAAAFGIRPCVDAGTQTALAGRTSLTAHSLDRQTLNRRLAGDGAQGPRVNPVDSEKIGASTDILPSCPPFLRRQPRLPPETSRNANDIDQRQRRRAQTTQADRANRDARLEPALSPWAALAFTQRFPDRCPGAGFSAPCPLYCAAAHRP